jgi:hypothetical protein
MIYQFCMAIGIPDELEVLFAKYRKLVQPILADPTTPDLLGTFLKVFRASPVPAFLIMDALDEIPYGMQRTDFLGLLGKISDLRSSCLHVLVTSQNEPDFEDTFRWELNWEAIGVSQEQVKHDIRVFVRN